MEKIKTTKTKELKETKSVDKLLKELLKKRAIIKKKKPKFIRTDAHKLHRLKKVWRKPTGRHNKVRTRDKGALPHPSYSSPKAVKYLHPSGKREVLVHNENELKLLDNKKEVARIAGSIGLKKRIEILKAAEKIKIRLLNVGKRTNDYLKKLESKNKEEKGDKKKEEKK